MKKIFAFITVISFVAFQGCSAFRSSTQTVNIHCTEAETILMINGQYKTCPLQYEEKRNRPLYVQAYKPDYLPYGRSVGYHMNITGVLDFVGGLVFLVPALGVLMPGAWDLDETDITVQLLQSNARSIPATPQTVPSPAKPEHK